MKTKSLKPRAFLESNLDSSTVLHFMTGMTTIDDIELQKLHAYVVMLPGRGLHLVLNDLHTMYFTARTENLC